MHNIHIYEICTLYVWLHCFEIMYKLGERMQGLHKIERSNVAGSPLQLGKIGEKIYKVFKFLSNMP